MLYRWGSLVSLPSLVQSLKQELLKLGSQWISAYQPKVKLLGVICSIEGKTLTMECKQRQHVWTAEDLKTKRSVFKKAEQQATIQ